MWESCGNIARRLRTRGKKTKYVQLITLHSLYTQKANMLNSTCASMTWTYVAFLSLSLSLIRAYSMHLSLSLSLLHLYFYTLPTRHRNWQPANTKRSVTLCWILAPSRNCIKLCKAERFLFRLVLLSRAWNDLMDLVIAYLTGQIDLFLYIYIFFLFIYMYRCYYYCKYKYYYILFRNKNIIFFVHK